MSTTANLPISNVVEISIASPQTGLSDFQVNNIAIGTRETPINPPAAGYAIYLDTLAVAADWGTGSEVYAQAVALFSQRPNPLSGGGALIVYAMGSTQTLSQAINALSALIFFGAFLYAGYNPINSEIEAAATLMNELGLIFPVSSYLTTDLNSGGLLQVVSAANEPFARPLYYGQVGTYASARIFAAAYIGRAMSVNFEGNATTNTMQMKDLAGVTADSTLTQTILNTCETLGVDCYGNIGGIPKTFSNGGPGFNYFDNMYNLEWLTFALEVALFNVIATTPTKIPQTEAGMTQLKNAVIGVLQQAVSNGYLAPGAWNAPDTFGNPATFEANIAALGYYVWSAPVSQQSETQREERVAPLIQVAIKLAGAVHSSQVLVYINA